MAAVRPAARSPRRHAAPSRAPAEETTPLRVVRAPERARSVGVMGTVFVVFVFATLFALAALHAVLVETSLVSMPSTTRTVSCRSSSMHAWPRRPASTRPTASVRPRRPPGSSKRPMWSR